MGVEIKQGLDTTIDDAANVTGSATGWASRTIEVMEALKSTNNELGSAALANAVATATEGAVPVMNADGKIAAAQLPTATSGGGSNAGLIPLLNASGLLASSMIPSGSTGGGGGLRGVWIYTNQDPNGNTGAYSSTDRQWSHTWAKPTNVTNVLVLATGGGGSGAHGPAATGRDAEGNTGAAGWKIRKGGGGGAGSTVLAMRTPTGNSYTVKVGRGGAAMVSGAASTSYNGSNSAIEELTITGAGGSAGGSTGGGGQSTSGGAGTRTSGIEIRGGSGADGTFDRFGGGHGGASFWGGGNDGAGGQSGASATTAPGGGGGATHGSVTGGGGYTFTADRDGYPGNDGIVVIIGFG